MRGSPTLCQAPLLLFLGGKIWMLHNISISVEQVALGPFTLPPCRNRTRRFGQGTECTRFVRHANLLGLSQNGHPWRTSSASRQPGREMPAASLRITGTENEAEQGVPWYSHLSVACRRKSFFPAHCTHMALAHKMPLLTFWRLGASVSAGHWYESH